MLQLAFSGLPCRQRLERLPHLIITDSYRVMISDPFVLIAALSPNLEFPEF